MTSSLLLDRYQLNDELGRGGMGTVYRGYDTFLEREVAVKLLSGSALGTEGRSRLLQEARATAGLKHPNVVTVYDAGETGGSPFIVMELIEGRSLHERRPQEIEEILTITRQVCAALEHAHENGIIHRDLKPENVLLTKDGTAKLVDFGLARSVASRLTAEQAIIGTVSYMAPELALGREFDGRADLYALGVMLYELTTGELPFMADDPVAIISQHLHAPVVPPLAKNERIPAQLNRLIVSLLDKLPDRRPASAAEVRLALDKAQLVETQPPAGELSELDRIVRGRLVGREQEVDEAQALWQKAAAGEGQVLLISGEPGIGKTRLVTELVTRAEVSGARALVGASFAEGGTPYAPFRQMLRNVPKLLPSTDLVLLEPVLADVLTLVPELRLLFPDVPVNPPLDPQSERQRLFENIVVLFALLCSRTPIQLVLEDAHWADSGTLSLLHYLARNSRQQPLMIVATYREVEVDDARAFHEMLLDLDREKLAKRIKLTRLDRQATSALLATIFAEEITPQLLEGIYRETEGNPFFVEEVCKALVESGRLYFENGRWHRPSIAELGIPQSVRVAIQSRVRELSEETQKVLELAAVLGREFDFETLEQASDNNEDSLIEALEEAERSQLISEVNGDGDEAFAFAHALIPATLVEGIRALRRRRLHRRVALALEARHPDKLEALARHFIEGGEIEKGVDYLMQAGDRARTLYAHQEAIDAYQQALEQLQEIGNYDQAAHTLMKLGLTYHSAFEYELARQAYQEGFSLWQRANQADQTEPIRRPVAALRVPSEEPLTIDPAHSGDVWSGSIVDQLFSGLVEATPDLGVVPDVARSWEVLDDGRRYVFQLRQDVRWSDGLPVTAQDFEYAWRRVLDPRTASGSANLLFDLKHARAYHLGELADAKQLGVRALGDWILEAELEEPTSYFLHLLDESHARPVPRHVVTQNPVDWADASNIVTCGPFRLVSWRSGESLVLERYESYHGRASGNVRRVELSLGGATDPDSMIQLYEANLLDVAYIGSLEPAEFNRIRYRHADDYLVNSGMGTDFIWFDTTRPPLDDARVRRALAMAIDRYSLADDAYGGLVFPADGGVVPPGMPGHAADIALACKPDEARALLAEAGYPEGRGFPPLECHSQSGWGRQAAVESIQAQWLRNLGIELRLEFFPSLKELFARGDERPPHLFVMGWRAGYPDPHDFLTASAWSRTGWRSREYEQLVAEAGRIADQSERLALCRKAELILVEEVPAFPIAYHRGHYLQKPWIKRYPRSPINIWYWKDVVIKRD